MIRQQGLLGDYQVRQREQGVQVCRVLGQTTVADFAMTEPILEDMERMLDARAKLRFESLGAARQFLDRAFRHGLELPPLHGNVPPHRLVLERLALVCADVAGIGKYRLLLAMQQVFGLAHIRDVGGGPDMGVDQSGVGIHTVALVLHCIGRICSKHCHQRDRAAGRLTGGCRIRA